MSSPANMWRLLETRFHRRDRGFSMIEMLVTLMMAAVLSSVAVSNLKQLDNPLQDGAAQLSSFMKAVRARAMSQTVAYQIAPFSSTKIRTTFGNTCATATTNDPALELKLPNGTNLAATNWSVCFTSRGLANANTVVVLQQGANTKNVEVMLGGGVRIQ